MSSRISPHHSQRSNFYRKVNRPDGSPASDRGRSTARTDDAESSLPTESPQTPDLGEDLSAEERKMIHDQFPPSPETTMRIYGRDRDGRQVRPGSLGNRIDLKG